jgi:hypothetical protein
MLIHHAHGGVDEELWIELRKACDTYETARSAIIDYLCDAINLCEEDMLWTELKSDWWPQQIILLAIFSGVSTTLISASSSRRIPIN